MSHTLRMTVSTDTPKSGEKEKKRTCRVRSHAFVCSSGIMAVERRGDALKSFSSFESSASFAVSMESGVGASEEGSENSERNSSGWKLLPAGAVPCPEERRREDDPLLLGGPEMTKSTTLVPDENGKANTKSNGFVG